MFIKYEAEVSSSVGGGERGVVDFGKLFTETSEQKFSLGGCVSKQQVYSSSQGCHIATGTHMPRGITQCYLPPGRGDIPALTPAEAGTRLSDPRGMQG